MRYLSDLSESTLYLLYEPALSQPSTSTRAFDSFTQLHRDLFLRLKLRSIESKLLPPKPQPPTYERPSTTLSTMSDLHSNDELSSLKERVFTLEQKFNMLAHLGNKVDTELDTF